MIDVEDWAEVRRLHRAVVIAERIEWPHGMTILNERVRELRPLFVPPDPVQRTTYRPGLSRLHAGWMVPTRAGHDVLGGML